MKVKSKIQPVLIIHGGAGSSPGGHRSAELRKKIRRVLSAAHKKLLASSAVEAVTYAVRLLEDDPAFNAGTGSVLQSDGKARLTASVMDGERLVFAAVINVENMKNPVLIARKLLEEESRILSGAGAFRFARKKGFKKHDPRTPLSIRAWRKKKALGCDTVGACALDASGRLASATSTGGRGMEFPGRVSDSGMPAANYATADGAVSATGHGEEIVDEALAARIIQRVQDGMTLERAFAKTFAEVRRRKKRMGAIGLDKRGRIAHRTSTPSLIYGWKKGGTIKTF